MRFLIAFFVVGVFASAGVSMDTNDVNLPDSTSYDIDFWYKYLVAMRYAQLAEYVNKRFYEKPVKKECRAVGEMCTYHEDCCSFACLGYLKRCVSH